MLEKILNFLKKNYLLFVFILVSPGFWYLLFKFSPFLKEIGSSPKYVLQKISSFKSEITEVESEVSKLRWANIDREGYLEIASIVFYNKSIFLRKEALGFISSYSPRIFFQAGDGGYFSSSLVEPIPFMLFPFLIWGILITIKRKDFKLLTFLFLSGIPSYLTGKKNMAFLIPVFFFYLYLSFMGFKEMKNKKVRKVFLGIIVFYGIYITLRALIIKS